MQRWQIEDEIKEQLHETLCLVFMNRKGIITPELIIKELDYWMLK